MQFDGQGPGNISVACLYHTDQLQRNAQMMRQFMLSHSVLFSVSPYFIHAAMLHAACIDSSKKLHVWLNDQPELFL